MPRPKLISSTRIPRASHECLHVEAPGCIVNIHAGLTSSDGEQVTRVSVNADGDNYAGDQQWWCPDLQDPKGIGVRVVQMSSKPEVQVVDALVDELDNALQDVCVETGWNSDSQVTMLLRYICDLAHKTRFEKRTNALDKSQTVEDLKLFLEQQAEFERSNTRHQHKVDKLERPSWTDEHKLAGITEDTDVKCEDICPSCHGSRHKCICPFE